MCDLIGSPFGNAPCKDQTYYKLFFFILYVKRAHEVRYHNTHKVEIKTKKRDLIGWRNARNIADGAWSCKLNNGFQKTTDIFPTCARQFINILRDNGPKNFEILHIVDDFVFSGFSNYSTFVKNLEDKFIFQSLRCKIFFFQLAFWNDVWTLLYQEKKKNNWPQQTAHIFGCTVFLFRLKNRGF